MSMTFEKIAGMMRVATTSAGAPRTYKLGARPGGRSAKSVQYTIKVGARSGANAQLQLDLHHGPDASLSGFHSNVIPLSLTTSPPSMMMGDVAATPIIGEWLHPQVRWTTTARVSRSGPTSRSTNSASRSEPRPTTPGSRIW